jgi:chromosome segregation ATPase
VETFLRKKLSNVQNEIASLRALLEDQNNHNVNTKMKIQDTAESLRRITRKQKFVGSFFSALTANEETRDVCRSCLEQIRVLRQKIRSKHNKVHERRRLFEGKKVVIDTIAELVGIDQGLSHHRSPLLLWALDISRAIARWKAIYSESSASFYLQQWDARVTEMCRDATVR